MQHKKVMPQDIQIKLSYRVRFKIIPIKDAALEVNIRLALLLLKLISKFWYSTKQPSLE